jgi:hypothetical protein
VFADAYLQTLSAKQKQKFLCIAMEGLERLSDVGGKVRRIRDSSEDREVERTTAEAVEWLRRSIPRLLNTL